MLQVPGFPNQKNTEGRIFYLLCTIVVGMDRMGEIQFLSQVEMWCHMIQYLGQTQEVHI